MSDGYYEDSWIPTDNNVYVQIVRQIYISDNSNTVFIGIHVLSDGYYKDGSVLTNNSVYVQIVWLAKR